MKEEDIRPQKIFDEYLELAKNDTKNYFGDSEKRALIVQLVEIKARMYFLKMVSNMMNVVSASLYMSIPGQYHLP